MGMIALLKSYFKAKGVQEAWDKSMWDTKKLGWMSISGALIVGISGALQVLESQSVCTGCGAIGDAITELGLALGIIGLRRAAAKSGGKQ